MDSAKMCTNIISITYYGTDEEKYEASKIIYSYLSKWKILKIVRKDGNIVECHFQTPWVSPLTIWEELTANYLIDIIGVAYELTTGYVEAFTYYTKLNELTEGKFINLSTEETSTEILVTAVNSMDELDELEEDIGLEFTDKDVVK